MLERNKIAPWQSRGRWYEVFLESNGSAVSFTKGDIGSAGSIVTADNTFAFPADFHLVDVKIDVNTDTGTEKWWQHRTRMYANGSYGIELPSADNFDYLTIYAFGYYDTIQ